MGRRLRERNRVTVERLSHDALDVRELKRLGLMQDRVTAVTTGFRWPSIGRIVSGRHWLELENWDRNTVQRVRVSWTRCHLGGWRPWMHCPYCQKRVAKLLKGAAGYCCRTCIGEPMYASQAKSTYGRIHFELCKVRRQLGGIAAPTEPFPERPFGMHRKTYTKLKARALELEANLPTKHRLKTVDYPNLVVHEL